MNIQLLIECTFSQANNLPGARRWTVVKTLNRCATVKPDPQGGRPLDSLVLSWEKEPVSWHALSFQRRSERESAFDVHCSGTQYEYQTDDPFFHESTRPTTCMMGGDADGKRFKVSRSFKRTDVGTLMQFMRLARHILVAVRLRNSTSCIMKDAGTPERER